MLCGKFRTGQAMTSQEIVWQQTGQTKRVRANWSVSAYWLRVIRFFFSVQIPIENTTTPWN